MTQMEMRKFLEINDALDNFDGYTILGELGRL